VPFQFRILVLSLFATAQFAWAQPDGLAVRSLRLFAPSQPTPLTQKERLKLFFARTAGLNPIVASAAGSGFSQWLDSPPEWGQGAEGYGKRVAHRLAFGAVRNGIAYAASAVFEEDTRYFASGKTTAQGRIAYALLSPVTARRGEKRTVSVAGVGGIVGAALISRAWSPESWRSASDVGACIGLTYAGTAGFNVFREFVPTLIRVIRRQPRQ
jgi:hypothetical protein